MTDALWVYQTAYKTNLHMSPYRLVYEKACHLPLKNEHKVLWAIKDMNFDLRESGKEKRLQLNELEEICQMRMTILEFSRKRLSTFMIRK